MEYVRFGGQEHAHNIRFLSSSVLTLFTVGDNFCTRYEYHYRRKVGWGLLAEGVFMVIWTEIANPQKAKKEGCH